MGITLTYANSELVVKRTPIPIPMEREEVLGFFMLIQIKQEKKILDYITAFLLCDIFSDNTCRP